MITPMKKISVLCLLDDKDITLDRLRDLGVLHVVPRREITGETLEEAAARVAAARLALDTLEAAGRHGHHEDPPCEDDPDTLIGKVTGLHERRAHLEEQLATLRQSRHALLPFGDFSPADINALKARGIRVGLYHVRDLDRLDIPEGVQVHVLARDKNGAHIAAIADRDFTLPALPFHMPARSLSDIEADAMDHERRIRAITSELQALAACRTRVAEALHQRMEAAHYAEIHDTMGRQGRVAWLSGFCPADTVESVRRTAAETGWGLKIEDPAQDDPVPTLIRFPAWVKPIKAVFQMLSILPGYRESDISGVFLVFFSIFFAILIGDAGYGLLFLAITLYARHRLPKAPGYPFALFGILSAVTLAWGALTGNWFGVEPAALPGALRKAQVEWLVGEQAQNNVISLCFLIGAVHLTIAHVWNALALAPALKTLAQLGWIGLVWSMYLTALNMVLGRAYPAWFLPLFMASLALILLFMTSPKDLRKDWIQHAMFPLSVVNCFVDIVSYIRLFAVGMASLSVARSFNGMAMQIGLGRVWTVPLVALVLLLGHGLNILLCALGILVHGVRLNTLEFSLHKNIEWKGEPYRPFARLAREVST